MLHLVCNQYFAAFNTKIINFSFKHTVRIGLLSTVNVYRGMD